ncbi:UPF0262 family protein [Rhizobium mongolense]|uniref:UPF0262 family protein n=1 Tax=Rhizobium mongolense TaxID=57676 RepID=UPI0035568EFA
MTSATSTPSSFRLCALSLDPPHASKTDSAQQREQGVVISDLLHNNIFVPVEHGGGPYQLVLALMDRYLRLSVKTEKGAHVLSHHLSLTSFRRLFRDYSLVCESFAAAAARLTPDRLEAIDMGPRAIHDEGSELLRERLKSKVEIDQQTGRRLFTLIHLLVSQTLPAGVD